MEYKKAKRKERKKTVTVKRNVTAHLDGFWDLVDILRFDDSFQVILQNLCEVVLQLRAAEVRQNFGPIWWILKQAFRGL